MLKKRQVVMLDICDEKHLAKSVRLVIMQLMDMNLNLSDFLG